MEKVLESYLEKVSKYLKRIPVAERADIIKEIICQERVHGNFFWHIAEKQAA